MSFYKGNVDAERKNEYKKLQLLTLILISSRNNCEIKIHPKNIQWRFHMALFADIFYAHQILPIFYIETKFKIVILRCPPKTVMSVKLYFKEWSKLYAVPKKVKTAEFYLGHC